MKEVQYKGSADVRTIREKDFERFGVSDQGEVKWGLNGTAPLDDEVADILVEKLPNEFVIVDENEQEDEQEDDEQESLF